MGGIEFSKMMAVVVIMYMLTKLCEKGGGPPSVLASSGLSDLAPCTNGCHCLAFLSTNCHAMHSHSA